MNRVHCLSVLVYDKSYTSELYSTNSIGEPKERFFRFYEPPNNDDVVLFGDTYYLVVHTTYNINRKDKLVYESYVIGQIAVIELGNEKDYHKFLSKKIDKYLKSSGLKILIPDK